MVVSVRADFDEVRKTLDDVGAQVKNINRKILTGVGTKAKNAARRAYGATLHRRSGDLYEGIFRAVTRKGDRVVVYSPAAREGGGKRGSRYGFILASGATIKAKGRGFLQGSKPYLTFKVEGQWKKASQVTLPARDWLTPAISAYLASPQYSADINRILDREIKKLFEKQAQQ